MWPIGSRRPFTLSDAHEAALQLEKANIAENKRYQTIKTLSLKLLSLANTNAALAELGTKENKEFTGLVNALILEFEEYSKLPIVPLDSHNPFETAAGNLEKTLHKKIGTLIEEIATQLQANPILLDRPKARLNLLLLSNQAQRLITLESRIRDALIAGQNEAANAETKK